MQRHGAINNSIDVIMPFRIASCWTISNTQPIWWQVKRLTSTSTPTDHSCSTNARSALPLRYGTILPFGNTTIIRSPTASAHDPPAPNRRASELPNSHNHCPTRLVGLWYQNETVLVTSVTMELFSQRDCTTVLPSAEEESRFLREHFGRQGWNHRLRSSGGRGKGRLFDSLKRNKLMLTKFWKF